MTNQNGLALQAAYQEQTRSRAVAHRAPWSQNDRDTLIEELEANEYKLSAAQVLSMAEVLGRTYGSIIVKAHELREDKRRAEQNRAELARIIDGAA